MSRKISLPNPPTPGNKTQMPKTIPQASGPITVTATVTRGAGDDSPVTVRLVNDGIVLGSTNLTTPAGSGEVTFSFDASLLGNTCDFEPTIEVIPCVECTPIMTGCCPNGLPRRLMFNIISANCNYGGEGDCLASLVGFTTELIYGEIPPPVGWTNTNMGWISSSVVSSSCFASQITLSCVDGTQWYVVWDINNSVYGFCLNSYPTNWSTCSPFILEGSVSCFLGDVAPCNCCDHPENIYRWYTIGFKITE